MVRDFPPNDPNFSPGNVSSDLIYVPSHSEAFRRRSTGMRVSGETTQFDPDRKGAVFIWDTVEKRSTRGQHLQLHDVLPGALPL